MNNKQTTSQGRRGPSKEVPQKGKPAAKVPLRIDLTDQSIPRASGPKPKNQAQKQSQPKKNDAGKDGHGVTRANQPQQPRAQSGQAKKQTVTPAVATPQMQARNAPRLSDPRSEDADEESGWSGSEDDEEEIEVPFEKEKRNSKGKDSTPRDSKGTDKKKQANSVQKPKKQSVEKAKSLTVFVKQPKPGHDGYETYSEEEEVSSEEYSTEPESGPTHPVAAKAQGKQQQQKPLGASPAEHALGGTNEEPFRAQRGTTALHNAFEDDPNHPGSKLENYLAKNPQFLEEFVVKHINPATINDWMCRAQCEEQQGNVRRPTGQQEQRTSLNQHRRASQNKRLDTEESPPPESAILSSDGSEIPEGPESERPSTKSKVQDDSKPKGPPAPVQLMFDSDGVVKVMTPEQVAQFKELRGVDLNAIKCCPPPMYCGPPRCPPPRPCPPHSYQTAYNNGRRACYTSCQPMNRCKDPCAVANSRRQASALCNRQAVAMVQFQSQVMRASGRFVPPLHPLDWACKPPYHDDRCTEMKNQSEYRANYGSIGGGTGCGSRKC